MYYVACSTEGSESVYRLKQIRGCIQGFGFSLTPAPLMGWDSKRGFVITDNGGSTTQKGAEEGSRRGAKGGRK